MSEKNKNPDLPNGSGSRLDDGPGLADFLPDVSGGYKAVAGIALKDAPGPADVAVVEEALRTVHDPEIPVNIFDLGLIYDVNRKQNGDVHITMSLTAPGCPVAGEMPGQVARAVADADGVGAVTVELVWEPAWSPDQMSEDAKMALDMGF